jgi:CheY-like chemotaxis protein
MAVLSLVTQPKPALRRRILVVDDDLDTVHSAAMLLKEMGHEVQFAINGFAALDVARRFKPDLILLDIALPDFEGSDAARQLKWEPGLENTRIVAVSGHGDAQRRQRAFDAGCEDYLIKPIDAAALERLIAG